MPLWRKHEEEDPEARSERLRRFRGMYTSQYGSTPPTAIKEVGEPVTVQALCPICSEPMQGPTPAQAVCPAARAEPVLHERLHVALQHWRGGQVQGRTIPSYNRTIALMRAALKRSLERQQKHAPPRTAKPSPHRAP